MLLLLPHNKLSLQGIQLKWYFKKHSRWICVVGDIYPERACHAKWAHHPISSTMEMWKNAQTILHCFSFRWARIIIILLSGDIFQNLMHSTTSERIYNCGASFWDHSLSNLLLLLLSKMLEWTGWMDTRVGYAVGNHAGKPFYKRFWRIYALIIFQICIVYSDQYINHIIAYMQISAYMRISA